MPHSPDFLRNTDNMGNPSHEYLTEVGYSEQLAFFGRNINKDYVLQKLAQNFKDPNFKSSQFLKTLSPPYSIFTERFQRVEDMTDAELRQFYNLYFSSLFHTYEIIESASSSGILQMSEAEKPSMNFLYSKELAAALMVIQEQLPYVLTKQSVGAMSILKISTSEKQCDKPFASLIYYIFNDSRLIASTDENWPIMQEIINKQLFVSPKQTQ